MLAADDKASPDPHNSRGVNRVSLLERVRQALSPQTYKTYRLWGALQMSTVVVTSVHLAAQKLQELLHHTTTTKDGITGMLACLGSAATFGVIAVQHYRAYFRWRRGGVTMDDVSAEIEWMLKQRQKKPISKQIDEGNKLAADAALQEYLTHRSNIARLPWRWNLRKHELLKQLKRGPSAYQLRGLAGVALVEVLVPTIAWAVNDLPIMWFAICAMLVANVLMVIMWIIGDDDDLPPRPAPAKPVPTPGESVALPKMRPKVTGPKTWRS